MCEGRKGKVYDLVYEYTPIFPRASSPQISPSSISSDHSSSNNVKASYICFIPNPRYESPLHTTTGIQLAPATIRFSRIRSPRSTITALSCSIGRLGLNSHCKGPRLSRISFPTANRTLSYCRGSPQSVKTQEVGSAV